jgi:hypothetical protein
MDKLERRVTDWAIRLGQIEVRMLANPSNIKHQLDRMAALFYYEWYKQLYIRATKEASNG